MPGSTPVFALPYPLASEVVDPNAFLNLAAAIDSAMASVALERLTMLTKPWVEVTHFNAIALASATDQTVTWDAIGNDTAGMAPAIGGTALTVTQPGVYEIELYDLHVSGYTTFVDLLTGIFVNGNRLGGDKKAATAFSPSFGPSTDSVVTYPLYLGDVVTLHWQWSGTGTANSLSCTMTATMIAPLV